MLKMAQKQRKHEKEYKIQAVNWDVWGQNQYDRQMEYVL